MDVAIGAGLGIKESAARLSDRGVWADVNRQEVRLMIGLLADMGNVHFPDLLSSGSGGIGLSGPIGLSNSNSSGDSVGLSGGVGLQYYAGSGNPVGLSGGIGLFA